jgi:hypothetical protein
MFSIACIGAWVALGTIAWSTAVMRALGMGGGVRGVCKELKHGVWPPSGAPQREYPLIKVNSEYSRMVTS